MSLADRPRPRLVVVPSTLGRHLFAFVWLPRDDLSTRRRVAIGEMLSEAANAALLSWSIAMEDGAVARRSEEHTSELQSLMRTSYAVFCWIKTKQQANKTQTNRGHHITDPTL